MANTLLKELKYSGYRCVAEVARRDETGVKFQSKYAEKAYMSLYTNIIYGSWTTTSPIDLYEPLQQVQTLLTRDETGFDNVLVKITILTYNDASRDSTGSMEIYNSAGSRHPIPDVSRNNSITKVELTFETPIESLYISTSENVTTLPFMSIVAVQMLDITGVGLKNVGCKYAETMNRSNRYLSFTFSEGTDSPSSLGQTVQITYEIYRQL